MNFFREATFFRTHLCILLAGKDCLLPLLFCWHFHKESSSISPQCLRMSPHRLRMTPHRLRMPSSSLLKAFFFPHYGFRLPPSILNASSLHLAYSARQRKLDVS